MILKIAAGKGWRCIDGIEEINFERATFKDKKNITYDAMFLEHHTLKDGVATSESPDVEYGFMEIWFRCKHGESQLYLLDGIAYLMSDEGKTIERIN